MNSYLRWALDWVLTVLEYLQIGKILVMRLAIGPKEKGDPVPETVIRKIPPWPKYMKMSLVDC